MSFTYTVTPRYDVFKSDPLAIELPCKRIINNDVKMMGDGNVFVSSKHNEFYFLLPRLSSDYTVGISHLLGILTMLLLGTVYLLVRRKACSGLTSVSVSTSIPFVPSWFNS